MTQSCIFLKYCRIINLMFKKISPYSLYNLIEVNKKLIM